jgi:hypothetical protein
VARGEGPLGANDPLRHGRLGDEERARDLVGAQTGDDPQRQCHPGLGGEHGVAGDDHQPKHVVIRAAALIAANYVLGRHYSRAGARGMAVGSRIAATVFLFGDLSSMSGGPAGSLVLAVTALWAMAWLGVVAYVERQR